MSFIKDTTMTIMDIEVCEYPQTSFMQTKITYKIQSN